MLLNKKIFFKYKSLLKVLSFNNTALNQSIWNVRNILRFIFFYLLKKSLFYHFVFHYKFVLFLYHIKKQILLNYNIFFNLFHYYVGHFVLLIQKHYFSNGIIDHLSIYKFKFFLFSFNYKYIQWQNKITPYYNFYISYKNYIFFIYIWVYSIKLFYFYSFNCSYLPTKKHFFILLRSPHKDKKSREKFKIKKLRRNLLLPSFITNPFLYSTIINEAILIKWSIHIKKS